MKKMKKWRVVSLVLMAAVAATAIWGAAQYQSSRQATARLENEYQRSFYSLLDDVENLEFLLAKAQIAGVEQSLALWSQAAAVAENAQRDLSALPVDHSALRSAAAYLNELGDFADSLVYKAARGRAFSKQELIRIGELYRQTAVVYGQLDGLEAQVADGRVLFSASGPGDSFTALNDSLPVAAVAAVPVKGLEKLPQIGEDEAKQLAVEVMKAQGGAAEGAAVTAAEAASIPVYQVTFDDGAVAAVSKQGGKLVSLWRPQSEAAATLSAEEAQQQADKFLTSLGYGEMVTVAQELTDRAVRLTLARREGEVLYYPDSVLVAVDLADGSVTAFQAGDYWSNYSQRQLSAPAVTVEAAQAALNPAFTSEENGLVLVAGQDGQELLCHEFRGRCGQDSYLIQVDAAAGFEENISRRVSGESGYYTR